MFVSVMSAFDQKRTSQGRIDSRNISSPRVLVFAGEPRNMRALAIPQGNNNEKSLSDGRCHRCGVGNSARGNAQNNATTGAVGGAVGGAIVGGPVGAVVGGVGGAIVGGIADDRRSQFHTYVVQEKRSSYRYNRDVVVGAELPSTGVTYYEVPAEYGVKNYRYTVVNDRTVLVDPHSHRIVQVIE